MTSLSTRFFGHPRLTKPTFWGRGSSRGSSIAVAVVFSLEREIVSFFEGMESSYFNIYRRVPRRTTAAKPSKSLDGPVLTRDYRNHERSNLWIKTLFFVLG